MIPPVLFAPEMWPLGLFELFAPEEDATGFPLVLLTEELVAVVEADLFPILLTCLEEEP
jgi:hypothetical protein